ncbi:MAG TPA: hypothetical protein PLB52_00785 [Candidatus Moranbacteria bacterium]|nr:hypothetical protein [Candidatus Moranbacteria bacterium]
MNTFLVLLKIVGVVGPILFSVLIAYKIVVTMGTFCQESCGYFSLVSVVAGIMYAEQLLLVAKLMEKPFYAGGLLCGMIISVTIFAWLMHALLKDNFSSGLHLLSLRGLII